MPSDINLDFADVRSIMSSAGTALMGMGRSNSGNEDGARQAALMAIDSPLLEMSIAGAKGVLFNVAGGKSLSMYEINEAARVINEQVDPDAKIIFGTTINPNLNDEVLVTVIATGFSHIENPENQDQGMRDSSVASPFGRDMSYNLPRFNTGGMSNGGSNSSSSNKGSDKGNSQSSRRSNDDDQQEFEADELDIPAFLRNKFPGRGE
jgi:cell division protein FtsZ